MDLEQQLKNALERKDPPRGFADRVAARVEEEDSAPRSYAPRWMGVAAAVLVAVVGSGLAYRHHQGEVAKEQVMTAMKITAIKLHRIQAHVREVQQ